MLCASLFSMLRFSIRPRDLPPAALAVSDFLFSITSILNAGSRLAMHALSISQPFAACDLRFCALGWLGHSHSTDPS
jgi:hypothetical protein